MKPGTQIAYVPMHAKGDITHPDVELRSHMNLTKAIEKLLALEMADRAAIAAIISYPPKPSRNFQVRTIQNILDNTKNGEVLDAAIDADYFPPAEQHVQFLIALLATLGMEDDNDNGDVLPTP